MHAITHRKEHTALAMLKYAGETKSDLNIANNKGRTALMDAAKEGMTEVTLSLMKLGADINKKNMYRESGKTALMYAIVANRASTALAMIKHSKEIDINAVNSQGRTALMKAASRWTMNKVVLALIKRGADANIRDKEGKTALIYAIRWRRETTALKMIRKCNVNVNIGDNEGRTPLMSIALSDHKVPSGPMFDFDGGILTSELIANGAVVNMRDCKGNTALMYNVKYEASIEQLMCCSQGRALVNQRNSDGRTALHYAILCNKKSVQILLENGAKHHLTDHYNASALTYYIQHCLDKLESTSTISFWIHKMYDMSALLKETSEAVSKSIIDAVFCKCPQFFLKQVSASGAWEIVSAIFQAVAEKGGNDTKQKLNDLVKMTDQELDLTNFLNLFTKLIPIVDDLNIGDQEGNCVLHYVILLGLRGYLSRKDFLKVCFLLEEAGLMLNVRENSNHDTLLIFALSNAIELANHNSLHIEALIEICKFLLERGYLISKDESQNGESVFHLILRLLAIELSRKDCQERFLSNVFQLLNLFLQPRSGVSEAVNKPDHNLNTPLHLWAAISPHSNAGDPNESASTPTKIWQEFSGKVFHQLFSRGAVLHSRNIKGETALHMCKTWTAVKLLVNVGAKTNDVDALERPPLLSSAKNLLFLKNPGWLYPDVSQDEAPTFWQTVLDLGFDLWTCDNNGDSIISILTKKNSFELADGLIEITCKNSQSLLDKTLVGVLNAICKDQSTQTTWKSILVDKLLKNLKSTRRSLVLSLPLRFCCMSIIDATIWRTETTEFDSVHYEIAKQLLRYGASGESCLDVAKGCPPLKTLLSTPVSMEERPFIIPWTSLSQKHKNQLAEVARGLNCNFQEPFWYHNKEIGRGTFGQVFVGIHGKDGMEVAVKRVHYTQQDRDEDIREIRSFASLPKCEHIVRYLTFFQTADFSYIFMELMEGDLDGYFGSNVYDQRQTKVFCRDVVQGLKYLHEQNIIHRDLKPTNILYKTDPQLCLKIADFGLCRRIDINATFTVMATGVGTRGWIAPEVMKSTTHEHSMSSDVFSCGLVFHYILSKDHRHPFSPADCTAKSELEIIPNTETNILNNNMEGWDSDLDPEASHVITGMLNCTNEKERPTAPMLLDHPMFWTKTKKLDFLCGVGNQEEFECPRTKKTVPLTMVEQDLENEFATIVKFGKWDDPRYTQTSVILSEMKKTRTRPDGTIKAGRKNYDCSSAVELVRLIRNAKSHVSEPSIPAAIKKQILEAVFLDEFPNLVIEVFKAVTKHTWDVREEIKYDLAR